MCDVAEVLMAIATLLKSVASFIRAIKGNGPQVSGKRKGRRSHRRRG